jgi:hypothetical protein
MVQRVTTLDELKGRTLEGVLYEVADSDESLTVVLGEDGSVVISPEVHLKPLPELEGRTPEGWKNAIYGEGSLMTSKLEQLKRVRFTPETKAERVARSLAALDQVEPIHLTPSEWRFVAEDPDIEDQY